MRKSTVVGSFLALFASVLPAQLPRVDRQNLHERVILVVPFVGSGTYSDPKRPLFVPGSVAERSARTEIVSWEWLPTDDGRQAIVEITARRKSALSAILADRRVVKGFQKGKDKAADVERELQKLRKDYKIDRGASLGRAK